MHDTIPRRPAARLLAFGAATLLPLIVAPAGAQVSTSPVEGIRDHTPTTLAYTHARLAVKPGSVIEDGTLLVREGVIVSATAGRNVPAGAAEIDLAGRTIYPGLIDADSDYAQVEEKAPSAPPPPPGPATPTPQAGARHWNLRVHPETDLSDTLKPDAKKAEALRKLGFVDVLSVPAKGVFRGQSALVTLSDSMRLNDSLLKAHVAQHVAFEHSNWPASDYPGSLMGAIALIRQTLYDTQWQTQRSAWSAQHRDAERAEANQALAALEPVLAGKQPLVLAMEDELDYARAFAIANEFHVKLVLRGNGREYRRAAQLKAAGVPVIVPLNFAEAPAIEDPDKALDVTDVDLEHWEWAPFNPRVLGEAEVAFAFTASKLKKPDEHFWPAVRKAVASGLDERLALAALTVQPATMLGVSDRLGTLEPGRLAHLLVADADLFRNEKARIYESWIDGKRYALNDLAATADPRGVWTLAWSGASGPASVEVTGELADLSVKAGDKTFPATLGDQRLNLYVPGALLGARAERVAVVGSFHGGRYDGRVVLDGAREVHVTGTLAPAAAKSAAPAKPPLPATAARFPAGAYGRTAPAVQQTVVVRHATVWTEGPQGTLADADLVVEKGKIVAVGPNLKAPSGALEIDGHGKHVAPGIIDAHSHMAIAHGVNEGTMAVTSEVRIGDVLDPTDMTIYRQLAGGVTSAQLLHGSANPIGGQSQIIKLRWGEDAQALKFAAAPQTIKFALGENVKQANWGDNYTKRYPQTRMGVEQIIQDSFNAARAYGAERKDAKNGPVRRDLRLEALWEVLERTRLVQIHSYRQDEILAFARLAQRLHIVPTFQHVLEGYKVADVLHELGAGASTFSDWWAYKMEVSDAIPYNGAIMTRQGVVVSFNSDSDEMGRRLNVEAAKAVKYGGLSETEALALVTINPAKQLHLDHVTGSLEAGKDADFVLWSGSPLSPLSHPEQTWIDGKKYFDYADDRAEGLRVEAERERLIAKALPERIKALAKKDDKKGKDEKKDPAKADTPPRWVDAGTRELMYRLATLRGPYHNDEPVDTCTAEEAL